MLYHTDAVVEKDGDTKMTDEMKKYADEHHKEGEDLKDICM